MFDAIVNAITVVLNYLSNIPEGFWAALVAGGVISGAAETVQVWVNRTVEKIKGPYAWMLVAGLSFAVALTQYVLAEKTSGPAVIALNTAIVGFMTTPVYYAFVRPLRISIVKTLTDAANFRALSANAGDLSLPPAEPLPSAAAEYPVDEHPTRPQPQPAKQRLSDVTPPEGDFSGL